MSSPSPAVHSQWWVSQSWGMPLMAHPRLLCQSHQHKPRAALCSCQADQPMVNPVVGHGQVVCQGAATAFLAQCAPCPSSDVSSKELAYVQGDPFMARQLTDSSVKTTSPRPSGCPTPHTQCVNRMAEDGGRQDGAPAVFEGLGTGLGQGWELESCDLGSSHGNSYTYQ